MENHYPIPIYYTYKDFESNYNSDFEQWLDLYPDGRESDFIAEVERKYSFFFADINERVSFMHYIIVHCYNDTKYLCSKNLEMEDFVSVLNFRIKDFIKNNPKTIINNISELSKIEDYILGKNKIDEYDIEYDDFNKYKEFIEVQNNESNFSLLFNYVNFRNFELSASRVFDELKKKKEVLQSDTVVLEINTQKTKKTSQPIVKEYQNQHNHIFANNGFEVWQSMFDNFGITEKSRTDVKFAYEVMKKDGLIFDTVNQVSFLDWICRTYNIVVQKTSNYSITKKRNFIYNNAKQLHNI